MAKPSFNFGANRKPRTSKGRGGKGKKSKKGKGNKNNAWRAYTGGGSSAPIPD